MLVLRLLIGILHIHNLFLMKVIPTDWEYDKDKQSNFTYSLTLWRNMKMDGPSCIAEQPFLG